MGEEGEEERCHLSSLSHPFLKRNSWHSADSDCDHLQAHLDNTAVTATQRMAVVALFITMVPYGMEMDMSAVINQETPAEWGLRDDLEVLLLRPYFALIAGALAAGLLGDRLGRRSMIYAHGAVYIPATLVSAMASTKTWFLAARFAMEFALGVAAPCVVTLAAEIVPRLQRDKAIILTSALAPALGSVLILLVGFIGKLLPLVVLQTADETYQIQTGSGAALVSTALMFSLVIHCIGLSMVYNYCVESPFYLSHLHCPVIANRIKGLGEGEGGYYTALGSGIEEEGESQFVNGFSFSELLKWLADLCANLPTIVLVCVLWGLSGVAHAVFLTGAPDSLMKAKVEWLKDITEHGLHLLLVGCKIWAAALCFFLSSRFGSMGSTSIVFLSTATLTLMPPMLGVAALNNPHWQLVNTMIVSVGVYVWCQVVWLMTVSRYVSSSSYGMHVSSSFTDKSGL